MMDSSDASSGRRPENSSRAVLQHFSPPFNSSRRRERRQEKLWNASQMNPLHGAWPTATTPTNWSSATRDRATAHLNSASEFQQIAEAIRVICLSTQVVAKRVRARPPPRDGLRRVAAGGRFIQTLQIGVISGASGSRTGHLEVGTTCWSGQDLLAPRAPCSKRNLFIADDNIPKSAECRAHPTGKFVALIALADGLICVVALIGPMR